MLTPSEALDQILARIAPLAETEDVPLAFSAGRVLAASPRSDVDIPPFAKAMMDGFACRSADLEGPRGDDGTVTLTVAGESRAGVPFDGLLQAGQAIEIYTGAAVPDALDQVVMVERTRREGNRVMIEVAASPRQHVQERAEILAAGDQPLEAGRRITPADLSVLGSIGAHPVSCRRKVKVSVLTTGDELVPAWVRPEAGQIRESNTLQLANRLLELEHEVVHVGIVPDEEELMAAEFGRALADSDALITTGGVSMGKYDLVGKTFESLGVEPVLHKVAIKPGKPIWFGMAGPKPVLGLPGNPVSALLGMEVFVRPALAKLGGEGGAALGERLLRGRWRGRALAPADRQLNLPCRLIYNDDAQLELEPVRFRGSADVLGAAAAEAFAVLPAGTGLEPGQVLDVRPLR